MTALWLTVLLAFHTVRVPSIQIQGQPYVAPPKLAQAFGWKSSSSQVYQTPNGAVAFQEDQVKVQGKPIVVRSALHQGKRYYHAEDLETVLDRVTGKRVYWDRERSRYILSRYPPSIKSVKISGNKEGIQVEIQHNADLHPTVQSLESQAVRVEIDRGFYKGGHRIPAEGVLSGGEIYHTARGFRLALRFDQPVEFEVRRQKTQFRVTFRPVPVASKKPSPQSPQPKWEKSQDRTLVIVIDPGHGGKDPGAIGRYGTREKTINLAVAKRLKRILEKDLHARVILTRDRDKFVPLRERAEIANRAGADLFISLHCNYERRRRAQGAETYFLSAARTKWERAVQNLENGALKYELGPELDTTDLLKFILSDMAQAQFLKESQSLAVSIQDHLATALKLKNRGVKQAGFYVLLGAYMPSVLVEMGFISHPSEEKRLRQGWYQEKIAKGIAKGIEAFLRNRDRAWVPTFGG